MSESSDLSTEDAPAPDDAPSQPDTSQTQSQVALQPHPRAANKSPSTASVDSLLFLELQHRAPHKPPSTDSDSTSSLPPELSQGACSRYRELLFQVERQHPDRLAQFKPLYRKALADADDPAVLQDLIDSWQSQSDI